MGKKAKAILPLEEAFKAAVNLANGERAVLVAGSIFVAAAVKELWINQQGNLQNDRNG
jgi:folylpolyglutamate synthase/dihydropteroate synthase